jgi:hypothetical protein
VFDDLAVAVKEVAATETADLADDELAEAVVELHQLTATLEAAKARLAAAWNSRGIWMAEGAKSGAAWLARETRVPREDCAATIRLGRRLGAMPVVSAAFEAGEISVAHVRRLMRCCNRRTAVLFRRDEAVLVEAARTLGFVEFCDAVDHWLLRADPDGADASEMERRERRRVSLDSTLAGMWSGSILLDPVSGEIVASELGRLEQRTFEADWAEAKAKLGRDPVSGELARTRDQRRADALVEMAQRSARIDAGRAARPLFSVVVGSETLSRMCQLASGQVVAPAALVPWLEAAEVERIVFDGIPDRVISVSRKRRFTGALRRLIEVRDRRCYHHYCDEPASGSQVDHIAPWIQGGMTEQSNGRMACGFHNRLRNRPPPRE